jgi:hypothetical protein
MDLNNFILPIILGLLGTGGLVSLIIHLTKSKGDELNEREGLTNSYKEWGQIQRTELVELKKEVQILMNKISDFEREILLNEIKYTVSINFNKDLLKIIRNELGDDYIITIPSQIEKDIVNGDKK